MTHDQEEALSIADKVAVMRDGRLVQVGTPRALYETPANAYVAGFVGQSNLWRGRVAGRGLVEADIGPLSCDTTGHATGDRVTVFVRPERILPVIAGEPQSEPGHFSGTVAADRYLGPIRRIDLALPGGLVRLETHLRDAVTSVRVPADAIRLLPAN